MSGTINVLAGTTTTVTDTETDAVTIGALGTLDASGPSADLTITTLSASAAYTLEATAGGTIDLESVAGASVLGVERIGTDSTILNSSAVDIAALSSFHFDTTTGATLGFDSTATINLLNNPISGFDGTDTIEVGNQITSYTYSGTASAGDLTLHESGGITQEFALTGGTDYGPTNFHIVDSTYGTDHGIEVGAEPPCYLRGTHILTPVGDVPVETLRPGDLVTTVSGAHRPLRWVGFGRTLVTPRNRDRATPVVVRRHALGEFLPRHDLYITRGHSLYLKGVLIPVEELINHRTIAWDETAQVVEYYHLELDSHDVVLAEGVAAETYREDDNSPQFQNVATRPERPPMPPYAPVLHDHPTVKRIWHELNERAGQPDLELTDDPDLHLLADGVRLDTEQVEAEVWRFRLPHPVSDLRIISRITIPSRLGIAQDQRRLGVAVRRIVLRQAGLAMEIAWNEPRLRDGFHNPETAEQHRWTDGEALLPPALLAPFTAGVEVELHLNGLLPYSLPKTAAHLARAA